MKNNGKAKVEQVEGILYLKDKNGEVLLSDDVAIHVPFSIPSQPDNHLEKGEAWDFVISFYLSSDQYPAYLLRDKPLADLEISLEVTSVRYKTNGSVDFTDQVIKVTNGRQ